MSNTITLSTRLSEGLLDAMEGPISKSAIVARAIVEASKGEIDPAHALAARASRKALRGKEKATSFSLKPQVVALLKELAARYGLPESLTLSLILEERLGIK